MTSFPFPSKVKIRHDLPSNPARLGLMSPPPPLHPLLPFLGGLMTHFHPDCCSEVAPPVGVGVWLGAASSLPQGKPSKKAAQSQ